MLESFRRLRSCCQTTLGMTDRNVDCVMTNHNEDQTKRWEGIKLLTINSRITDLVPIQSIPDENQRSYPHNSPSDNCSYRLVYRTSLILEKKRRKVVLNRFVFREQQSG